ncbi:hypothetical protein K1T71_009126 [Dendrolimus kikuchii]|uniref:Uncharacterized protein n=1 Tax=Dendrolimus kikuchii TaxID=765133 RepID=A0ACC1CTX8_9NEOP|nr:hypothetical protein K1T71_009126 [Dendrolimus kikuchii]
MASVSYIFSALVVLYFTVLTHANEAKKPFENTARSKRQITSITPAFLSALLGVVSPAHPNGNGDPLPSILSKSSEFNTELSCNPFVSTKPTFIGRKSEIKCQEYIWDLNYDAEKRIADAECEQMKILLGAKRNTTFVEHNKNKAFPGEYPHVGAIGWKTNHNTWKFYCGCSLISHNFVLTAAHCSNIATSHNTLLDTVPKIVRFVSTDLIDPIANDVGIAEIILHPKYEARSKYYDIALMKLEKEIIFGEFALPACLWTKSESNELDSGIITGWSLLQEYSEVEEVVAADVEIIESHVCDQVLEKIKTTSLEVIDEDEEEDQLNTFCDSDWCGIMEYYQFCAQLSGGDICQGDSGGSLQMRIPLTNNIIYNLYYVFGVSSFEFKCDQPEIPGIYAKAACCRECKGQGSRATLAGPLTSWLSNERCLTVSEGGYQLKGGGMSISYSWKRYKRDSNFLPLEEFEMKYRPLSTPIVLQTSTESSQVFGEEVTQSPNPCDPYITPKQDFNNTGRRTSETKCSEYIWDLNVRHEKYMREDECDALIRNRGVLVSKIFAIDRPHTVTPGRDTSPGEYPHMGALGWKAKNGTWIFKCGSTLISHKFVLTAAHCSKSPPDPAISYLEPKIVRLGDKNILDVFANDHEPFDVNILKIIVHPKYSSPKQYYDIALVELEKEVEFTKYIHPACLWTNSDTNKLVREATVTGWGVIETAGLTTSPELQAAVVDILDTGKCNQLLKSSCNRNWCGFRDHQICAGKLAGGVDTCQGDSGGPLQVKIPLPTDSQGNMHFVIGVISFGVKCAVPQLPGTYSRVTSFLDWIEKIVWPLD